MVITRSKVEMGFIDTSAPEQGIQVRDIDVLHNGEMGDLRSAIERFLKSNPIVVNGTTLALFCIEERIIKENGKRFFCLPYNGTDLEDPKVADKWTINLN